MPYAFPLVCSCGNKTFYMVWNVAMICNDLGEKLEDASADPQERYYCEKCGRMIVEGY